MTSASDKARFYLEQSVPELHTLERKKLFTRDEIQTIARHRSTHEHLVTSPAGRPADWARYAAYEANLRALLRKRAARRAVRLAPALASPRRVFAVWDRATRRFPGDAGLWMQYVESARREGAQRKVETVLTRALRLRPRDAGLWCYAAAWAVEVEGDVGKARGFVQRGLRFCAEEREVWVCYVSLEMGYLARIAGRRRILGLDGRSEKEQQEEKRHDMEEDGGDVIKLPDITADDDIQPTHVDEGSRVADDTLKNLASTPALTGAIPIAIFDAAMTQFHRDPSVALALFDAVAAFAHVPHARRVLQHILDTLPSRPGTATFPAVAVRAFTLPLLGVDARSAKFPPALRACLNGVAMAVGQYDQTEEEEEGRGEVVEAALRLLLPYLREAVGLDPGVRRVLRAKVRQLTVRLGQEGEGEHVVAFVEGLRSEGRQEDARRVGQIAVKVGVEDDRLRQMNEQMSVAPEEGGVEGRVVEAAA